MPKQFEIVIELRGVIVADSEASAMEICQEQARLLAEHADLGDYHIDEVVASKVGPVLEGGD